MSTETAVVGRDWERWRAIMTVARLFEQHGVAHLTSDMFKIMSGYQEQKDDLEGTSRIVLVIRALMRLVKLPEADKWTRSDMSDMSETRVRVQASHVVDMIKIALQEDSEDEDEGVGEEDEGKQKTSRWPNAKAVGIILSKLRLPKDRETSSGRARHRLISQKEVFQLAIAHHLVHLTNTMSNMSDHVHMSDEASPSDVDEVRPYDTPSPNGANGANGADGASGASKPAMSCPAVGDRVPPLSNGPPPAFSSLTASVLWCPTCAATVSFRSLTQLDGTEVYLCNTCDSEVGQKPSMAPPTSNDTHAPDDMPLATQPSSGDEDAYDEGSLV